MVWHNIGFSHCFFPKLLASISQDSVSESLLSKEERISLGRKNKGIMIGALFIVYMLIGCFFISISHGFSQIEDTIEVVTEECVEGSNEGREDDASENNCDIDTQNGSPTDYNSKECGEKTKNATDNSSVIENENLSENNSDNKKNICMVVYIIISLGFTIYGIVDYFKRADKKTVLTVSEVILLYLIYCVLLWLIPIAIYSAKDGVTALLANIIVSISATIFYACILGITSSGQFENRAYLYTNRKNVIEKGEDKEKKNGTLLSTFSSLLKVDESKELNEKAEDEKMYLFYKQGKQYVFGNKPLMNECFDFTLVNEDNINVIEHLLSVKNNETNKNDSANEESSKASFWESYVTKKWIKWIIVILGVASISFVIANGIVKECIGLSVLSDVTVPAFFVSILPFVFRKKGKA